MKLSVDKLSPWDWARYSETAHLICFGEHKPVSLDRIDFALVCKSDSNLLGYVTCREIDEKTLYWQFGGAFPGTKNSFRGYQTLIEYCSTRYKRLTTLIENTNMAMLKMAMKVGYRIVGIRFFNGTILLEHIMEFNNAL